MHIFCLGNGEPEVVERAAREVDLTPGSHAMKREIVGASTQIDVVGIGFPVDRHTHGVTVKRDRATVVPIGNPKCKVAQSECWRSRHHNTLAATTFPGPQITTRRNPVAPLDGHHDHPSDRLRMPSVQHFSQLTITVVAATALGSLGGCDTFIGGQGQGQSQVKLTAPTAGQVAGAARAAACPELTGGGSALAANFDANATINAKVGAFVQAAKDLTATASRAEAELTNSCKAMGRDLGLNDAQMQPKDGSAANGACGAVAGKIAATLQGGASVSVKAQPPQCQVNAQAQASCEGRCRVEVEPAKIVASCEPAKLSGTCEGTCQGQCQGTCSGKCNGECTAKDAQGNCVGECRGSCEGSCSGTCHARCQGTWKAPKCEGSVEGGSVDADCKASCKASADLNASCTKPTLQIQASQNTEAIAKLIATLKLHLPALLKVQFKLTRQVSADVQNLVKISGSMRGNLQGAGNKALACVTAAGSAIASAAGSIKVSASASASVSGRVGASM